MKAKRNCDIIKDLRKENEKLRYELGRFEDKVKRQEEALRQFHEREAISDEGLRQMSKAVDDIVAKTAIRYGDEVRDEATGELLGYNLMLPRAKVEGVQAVQAQVWREDDSQILIGVTMLEGQADEV